MMFTYFVLYKDDFSKLMTAAPWRDMSVFMMERVWNEQGTHSCQYVPYRVFVCCYQ